MKIRVRFEKDGSMRFIGHLDIMRFFHKAFQRAGIPIRFSEGFHPHPVMSFAAPLSVGLSSKGEYLDTEITGPMGGEEMLRRLNAQMTPGIRVTGIRALPEEERKKGNNAMALVGLADYRVRLLTAREEADPPAEEMAAAFLREPDILVSRKTKHKEEETNIRPWILSFRYDAAEDAYLMRLSSGSAANLKPEAVMEAYLAFCGMSDRIPKGEDGTALRENWLSICRLDMLTAEGVSLGDLGEALP